MPFLPLPSHPEQKSALETWKQATGGQCLVQHTGHTWSLACCVSLSYCKENGILVFFQASHLLQLQLPSVTAHPGEQQAGQAQLLFPGLWGWGAVQVLRPVPELLITEVLQIPHQSITSQQ